MIDARELRIGNWFLLNDEPEQVKELSYGKEGSGMIEGWLLINDHPTSDADPIPLTEDILLKCGFVTTGASTTMGHTLRTYSLNGIYISVATNEGMGYKVNDEIKIEYNLKEIKYLHQLQNLIFALTGTELEITF